MSTVRNFVAFLNKMQYTVSINKNKIKKEDTFMHEIMNKYRSKMVTEGIIKSVLYALPVAFIALAIATLVFWFVGFEMVWIAAIIFAGAMAVVSPVLYFVAFRPDDKKVAKRVDKDLGLDERMLTMFEYRGSNDVMICAQRANAVSALRASSGKKLTAAILSTALIVAVAATFIVGAGTTTVSALSATGIIPSGKALFAEAPAAPATYTITYTVQGTGRIEGLGDYEGNTVSQTIIEGKSAKSIRAVPGTDEEGEWYFAGWSDGSTDPYRADRDVSSDITLVAVFELVEPDDGEDPYDKTPQYPVPPTAGSDGGGSSDSGDGGGAGGESNPNNQVIDGQTFYGGENYENAYNDAMAGLGGDSGLSDAIGNIVGDYAGGIQH